ncbi:PorV/PorQ family protein [Elusimicrobiota bacterium]
MKKINIILMVIVVFLMPAVLHAVGVGTTGAQFLKIEPSARSLGMGGAYSAVADDSSAIFYNPAGIAHQKERNFEGTYLQYFQAIDYGSLAGVIPAGNSSVGVGINYLGVPDIEKRGNDDVDDPDGTRVVNTFTAMDTALSLSYARQNAVPSVLEGLDLGGNLRFIYQTIDDENAYSLMLDLGCYYPLSGKLALALNIQNIGLNVKFKEESDPLPLNFKVGAAYKPINNLTIACDINEYIIDRLLYASVGSEYWILGVAALRVGYKYGYDIDSLGSSLVGLAGGIGFRLYGIGLDYSYAPFGELGDTNRFTFLLKF